MGSSVICNYLFKGLRDWRSFDIGVMEKVIAVNMVLGVISSLIGHKDLVNVYQSVFIYSTLYFIIGPVFSYYRTFKTDECSYIFIAPIKKSYILLTSLSIWIIGFSIFILSRILVGLMDKKFIDILVNIDKAYMIIYLINIGLVLVSFYLVIIATDIITICKRIPRIITYPIAAAILVSRIYIPDFLVYYTRKGYDLFLFQSSDLYYEGNNINLFEVSTSLGPNLIILALALIIFSYALYIFEEYNGERKISIIRKYIIKDRF